MPTKDELEQQLAQAHARIAELEASSTRDITATTAGTSGRPVAPGYLSEGERQDLEANGVTVSPLTGATLNALDTDGVDEKRLTPEARRNAERHRTGDSGQSPRRTAAPLAGPPADPDATAGDEI